MSVIRIKKARTPYVTVDTTALNDERLSFRAKGLHTYLMSKPDAWQVHIAQLESVSPREGKDAIRVALKELEEAGYLARTRKRDAGGRLLGWETTVYETPTLATTPEAAAAEMGKTDVGLADIGLADVGKSAASNSLKRVSLEESKEYNSSASLQSYSAVPSATRADSPAAADVSPPASATPVLETPAKPTRHVKPLCAEDRWLVDLLAEYALPVGYLDDDDWWALVSRTCGGIDEEWFREEFARMRAWLVENPTRTPGTSRGWKRFVRTWLERAHEQNRRKAYHGQGQKVKRF